MNSRASKDLTCLMSMHSSQIYTGINWEKKYKSPTPWCISIKLTKLQIKNSQYIKYICADDELTFRKWVAALRIAKSGSDLLLNYERATGVRPCRPASPTSSIAASVQSSNTTASSSSTTTSIAEMPTRPLTVDMRVISPSVASTMSKPPSLPSPSQSHASFSSVANSTVIEYDEQPTGTIKRAPIDALRYVSRMSSSSTSPTIPQEDTDSDEDFPAPPPSSLASRTPVQSPQGLPPPPKPAYYATPQPARPAAISPLVAPKPSTPLMAKKAPPPPPKRSEATRIQTVSATSPQPQQHMSDLEAALARRREKMAQVQ
ncbi:unnamed protein product [Caenorhabditis auriculariae]|uniref:PH domain-containing protein n=1 Tax=Caenorhabditis auriculariae TaxID=2777116 RepID=A0A8S1HCR3_9PELO|nr:unnamed protein product [Caenorhabditis auriculariae]